VEKSVEEYQKLKALVESAGDDIMKATGGNKAAGTRVRKIMQDIKNMAQQVRTKVLTMREGENPSESPPM
jgi:hypothetical protein